jgi:adenylate cyclase
MTDKRINWTDSEAQSIRDQLEHMLASDAFAQAERLGRFLAFAVEQSLAGNNKSLNQYAIAMEVFDRDESFDPNIDAIVRVEAGRLRSKLLGYYDEAGRFDPIQIRFAKRGYAANFQFRRAAEDSPGSGPGGGPTKNSVSPIIAVMPFMNMSADAEQEYFADGITEDLITDLSKLPSVSVISRQSTFAYKGVAVTVQQVCEEQGANLVLEGSVRKVGDSVRITAQLIDGASGKHIWAQRYQRDMGDIFELQDEVNQKVVHALSLQLTDSERQRLGRRGTDVIDAYDYVLRGMKEARAFTLEGSARARYCFESALQLDPGYATAYARLALNHIYRWIAGWSTSREDSVDKGAELAARAVALDDQLALAHAAMCWTRLWQGDHDNAIADGQRAIELDPNDVVALERLALCMSLAGDASSALPLIDRARRLNRNQTYNFSRGVAMFIKQDYAEAISLLRSDFEENPNFLPSGLYLASSYSLSGHADEAAATAAEIVRISPNYKIAKDSRTQFKNPPDRKRFVSGLRQAGLS